MKNLIQTAVEAGNFKTLITAMQEADLYDTLSGDGPYTVFAPTDEAFSKLPSGALENILQDKERLTEVLTYHVLKKKVKAKEVKILKNAKTVNGKEIIISSSQDVKINNARIIKKDIECSNGIIHVIDEVLAPN
jgi:uncharacterized surface protein with fasciclin (FAS1) repeats